MASVYGVELKSIKTWDGVSEYYGAFTQEVHDGTVMTEF